MKRPSASALAVALLATAASATPQLPNQSSNRGSTSVSRTCQRILQQPVSGCTTEEFATGSCSQACADGLESIQASIQQACEGVEGGPPFLKAALEDRLVETACRQGVKDDGDGDGDEDQKPTTTAERERDAPQTTAPSPTGQASPDTQPPTQPAPQPTGKAEERSSGDEGRPNGVGGSPFDIVAGAATGLRFEAGWMALGFGVLLLAR